MNINDTVTLKALEQVAGSHMAPPLVREGYVEALSREPRCQPRFKILKALPSDAELAIMRDKNYRVDGASVVDGAFNVFQELRDEIQDWWDNLPENFQNGDKGDSLQECISSLEQFADNSPDCSILETHNISVLSFPSNESSRSDRCSNAASDLRLICDEIDEKIEVLKKEQESKNEDAVKNDASLDTSAEDSINSLEELKNELESAADEAESMEFPGMY